MIKIAVLDDYQNIFEKIIDTSIYKKKFEFKTFNHSFKNEVEAAVELKEFDALFIMRERTPIT
jgi:D-3-phosphoglycerate dehydrogenase